MSNINSVDEEWNSSLLKLIATMEQLNSKITELESRIQVLREWIVLHEAWNHTDRGTLERIEAYHQQGKKIQNNESQ